MDRDINGILVVDKPADISSAKVVSVLKRKLGLKKAGHAGTLDPFATGVMVCCLNQATRLARFFLLGKKTYEALLRLGIDTDTQDFTGTVTATADVPDFSKEEIESAIKRFEGSSEQAPPVFSALKHNGVPLYKLARAGKPLQKAPRRIHISSIGILDIRLPEIRLRVSCSAGTYIRTLCADIGKTLGCGGHLKALRRTESSGFPIDRAVPLADIEKLFTAGQLSRRIIPMADALRGMPEINVADTLAEKIRNGGALSKGDFTHQPDDNLPGFIKIVDKNKGLIAVLEAGRALNDIRYCCVFPQTT